MHMSYTYRTYSWESNKKFYEELEPSTGLAPMIELVSAIEKSSYANGIYAFTSHAILCIGQHRELEERHARLHILPLPNKDFVIFKYKPDNSLEFTWEKEVSSKLIVQEFERFLKELKWIIY